MIDFYVFMIKTGRRTINEVPTLVRPYVEKELKEVEM